MTHRIVSIFFACALAFTTAACGDDGNEESSSSSPSSASEPSGGMSKLKQTAKQPGSGKRGADKQAAMKRLKKKMKARKKQVEMRKTAIAAAKKAESKGDSPCAKAFHGAVAMGDSIRKQRGMKRKSGTRDQEAFISVCKKLPEQIRKCMIPSYGSSHPDECRSAQKGADQETKKLLSKMMKQAR